MPNYHKVYKAIRSALKAGTASPGSSFPNYMGSKSKEAARIANSLQRQGVEKVGRRVVEPFGGSGAFSQEFISRGLADSAIIGDTNPITVNILRNIQKQSGNVQKHYNAFGDAYMQAVDRGVGKEFLVDLARKTKGEKHEGARHAAANIFISSTARNFDPGRIPVFRNSQQAVKDISKGSKAIETTSNKLRNAEIRESSWEDTLRKAANDDFVVLDPPYYKTRSYYGSTKDPAQPGKRTAGFTRKHHEKLKGTVEDLEGLIPGIFYNSKEGASDIYKWLDWLKTPNRINERVTNF